MESAKGSSGGLHTLSWPILAAVLTVAAAGVCRGGEAAPAGTVQRSVRVGALERTYLLHVPRELPQGRAVPLVLMFHGGGGTPAYAERESGFSALADREGFLVAYPEGFRRSWNDGRDARDVPAQREGVDDLAFVAALIDDVAAHHSLDRGRVYATGVSNGGIFSHYLAARLSSRLAAVAPVIGGLPKPLGRDFRPEKPVSVLVIQGVADPLVPYGGGAVTLPWKSERGEILSTEDAVRKWVEHDGCRPEAAVEKLPDRDPDDGCRVTRLAYSAGREGAEVVLYKIEGGGHTWPNGRQYLPEKTVGRVCRDIDGAEVIWEFFKAHPRPAATPREKAPSAEGGATGAERPAGELGRVGYRVIDLKPAGGAGKTVTVAVWYPTAVEPREHVYGGPTRGNVAVDAAPPASGVRYPLLVFSHGYGGSGLGSVFLTEELARRGWIVAAPDHNDRHSAVRIRTGAQKDFSRLGLVRHAGEIASSGPEDRAEYAYRLDEMKLTLDGVLESAEFGKLIDSGKVAVGGHSFGGFTALGLCGPVPERLDRRIRAVLLFSTGAGGYLFREKELAAVRMPAMVFLGERETEDRRGTRSMAELAEKIFASLPAPKYFAEVKGASHFSFNNCFSDTVLARALSGTEEQFEVIRRYSIAFLEKHVAGAGAADDVLARKDAMLSRYVREPGPAAAPAPGTSR